MNEPDDREPFPACDAFRLLEQVFTVDPRYASRSVLDPKVGARPMTIEDHWKYIATIALHEGVPSVIRVHFRDRSEPAPVLLVCYRFQQVAEMHAFASVEYALRMRSGLPVGQRGGTFGRLLNRAVKEGWIRDEGFQAYRRIAERRAASAQEKAALTGVEPDPAENQELRSYVTTLTDVLPFLRNTLAHGSAMLSPGKRTPKRFRGLRYGIGLILCCAPLPACTSENPPSLSLRLDLKPPIRIVRAHYYADGGTLSMIAIDALGDTLCGGFDGRMQVGWGPTHPQHLFVGAPHPDLPGAVLLPLWRCRRARLSRSRRSWRGRHPYEGAAACPR